MQEDTPRQTRQLVLVGGGHAHVAVLKSFGMQRLPEVRLVLISDHWDTPYSGMLPAHVAGHYTRDQIHVDLHRLCRFAGGEFCRDRLVGLDLKAKRVMLAERPPVHFDLLSINTGSTPVMSPVPGARDFAIPVKPISRLLERIQEVEERFLTAGQRPFRMVTVGAGAGGVELTLSVQHRLKELAKQRGRDPAALEFTIVTASNSVLPDHNRRVQQKFARILAGREVRVFTSSAVEQVNASEVLCAGGRQLPFDALFWATTAAAPEWPRAAGLDVDENGFITVNPCLQSTSHELVYAAGDVAAMLKSPRPKSGVFAVRQGPPLARNLRLALLGFRPRPYRPQRTFLSLISTGDRQAVASKGPWSASGKALWTWKQRIDQKWMRRYDELRAMTSPEGEMDFTSRMKGNLRTADPSAETRPGRMRCGGCGAKIGGLILYEALKLVRPLTHPSVMIGLNAPDDGAVITPPAGRLLVQSVDFFRTLINDPWLFGRIAASHALNDLFAMGATPLAAQATVTLELANDRIMTERLAHLLAGAAHQLGAAGASLIGGHSAEGRETALGLAVTGTAAPGRLFRKTGLRTGDRLILTKALGTGALFAADMAFQLRAAVLASAIDSMLRSNGPASEIFARHGVVACTDISGFGLLGHLREMLAGSELGVELSMSTVPALAGLREALSGGYQSTMIEANAHNLTLVSGGDAAGDSLVQAVILDPQTAGPLLAAVPETAAPAVLQELRESGYAAAAIIGVVTPLAGPKPLRLIK